MRRLFYAPAIALVVAIAGCTALGMAQPQTTKERLAYAYSAHTAIQNAAADALTAGEITSADGQAVLKLADESRTVLDAARVALNAGDTSTAEGRVALATSILTELQSYLRSRKGSGRGGGT